MRDIAFHPRGGVRLTGRAAAQKGLRLAQVNFLARGQPVTAPTASPCDWPNSVTRTRLPNSQDMHLPSQSFVIRPESGIGFIHAFGSAQQYALRAGAGSGRCRHGHAVIAARVSFAAR